MHPQRTLLPLLTLALAACPHLRASDELTTIAPGLTQRSGTDPTSGIAYTRILLHGTLVSPTSPPDAAALPSPSVPPTLIAQCTRQPNGKLVFELFTNFGDVADTAFHPPWRSTGRDDPFPPTTQKTSITFNFYGYTRVKPVTRQWESVTGVPNQWRYNNPSGGSHNLEEVAFYLQYLRALPTLRLTQNDKAAQFNVAPWMEAVRKDPLCKASGL